MNGMPPLTAAAPPLRTTIPVVTLGGTISMTGSGSGGLVPTLSGETLVAPLLRSLGDGIAVEFDNREPVASPNLTFAIIRDLAAALKDMLRRADIPGAVVVQGTDTIEETAFLLDLMLGDVAKPVVVTGAMRGADAAGADGPANMVAAIRVAAAMTSARRGVLLVLNDEIHAAAQVAKTSTSRLDAFISRNGGPLGMMSEGHPRYFHQTTHHSGKALSPTVGREPAVAIVKIGLGDEGHILQAIARLGYDGLIIEGMGAGHVPARLVPMVSAICAAMPVVLSSRTGSGFVHTSTYRYPGSETDLIAAGAIPSGFLDALKARMLLMTALACDCDRQEIAALYDAYR
jgi:L-asparaginase